MVGLEVEDVSEYSKLPPLSKGIVVGKVLSVSKHENADKLSVCSVDVGGVTPVKIVCGAPNVIENILVPVATVGTVLNSEEETFKVKKSKIRGIESFGMICSEKELGLGDDQSGIMVLATEKKTGTPLIDSLEQYVDTVFEIDLTPNRSDSTSHFGVARDIFYPVSKRDPQAVLKKPTFSKLEERTEKKIHIEVQDIKGCPRYCGVFIEGVKIKTSPDWLQNKLLAIGQTPINNVVDITNYLLFELGQPLHAFDFSHIAGEKIIVKTLQKGTPFVGLDGEKRKLQENDLMICNAEKPMCIAGVFGGENSMVTEKTTSIFLESAYFNPRYVRSTSKHHLLHTESAYRFERGVDKEITLTTLKRAAELITELSGGFVNSPFYDENSLQEGKNEIPFSFSRCSKILGYKIPNDEIRTILTTHNFQILSEKNDELLLSSPGYKVDVTREIDVVEEIARVYGYDEINGEKSFQITPQKLAEKATTKHKTEEKVATFLANNGFLEAMSNSIVEKSDFNDIVTIKNPLSTDLVEMRKTLKQSMISTFSRNHSFQNTTVKVFEFGNAYQLQNKRPIETRKLILGISGDFYAENWNNPQKEVNSFLLKAAFEAIFQVFGLNKEKVTYSQAENDENIIAFSEEKECAVFSEITSTEEKKKLGFRNNVFFCEIHLSNIFELEKEKEHFQNLPVFPSTKRDLSMTVPKSLDFESIKKVCIKYGGEILREIILFDTYSGKNIPQEKKALAIRLIFRDDKKTIKDSKVNKVMDKLIKELSESFSVELR